MGDIGINTSQIGSLSILAFVSAVTGYLFLELIRDARSMGSSGMELYKEKE